MSFYRSSIAPNAKLTNTRQTKESSVTSFPRALVLFSGIALAQSAFAAKKTKTQPPAATENAPVVSVASPSATIPVAPAGTSAKDSLAQLAKDVEIDEKVSKVMDVKVISDVPDYAKLHLRGELSMIASFGGALLDVSGGVVADFRVTQDLRLEGSFQHNLWNMYDISTAPLKMYAKDGTNSELPLAKPSGDPTTQQISLGASYVFSRQTATLPLPQVYSANALFSQSVGNTRYTAYDVNYVDVPLTREQTTLVRLGLLLESHTVTATQGKDGFLYATSGSDTLSMMPDKTPDFPDDTTNGWTNERNTILYLGIARSIRQGSVVDLTHRKSGTQYKVSTFVNNTLYFDLMYALSSKLDDVTYYGRSATIKQGDKSGQLEMRSLGARFGWEHFGGTNPTIPYGLEFGLMPGSMSFYFKFNVGVGYWI